MFVRPLIGNREWEARRLDKAGSIGFLVVEEREYQDT